MLICCMIVILEFPEKPFSHEHFSNGEVIANKSEANKKIAQEIKKQHFHIGDSRVKIPHETSHNVNFAKPSDQLLRRGSTPMTSNTVMLD